MILVCNYTGHAHPRSYPLKKKMVFKQRFLSPVELFLFSKKELIILKKIFKVVLHPRSNSWSSLSCTSLLKSSFRRWSIPGGLLFLRLFIASSNSVAVNYWSTCVSSQ